jgi:hypothetical protein
MKESEPESESEILKIEESRVGVGSFVYRLHSPVWKYLFLLRIK